MKISYSQELNHNELTCSSEVAIHQSCQGSLGYHHRQMNCLYIHQNHSGIHLYGSLQERSVSIFHRQTDCFIFLNLLLMQ